MNVSSIPSSPPGTAAIGNILPERQTANRATAADNLRVIAEQGGRLDLEYRIRLDDGSERVIVSLADGCDADTAIGDFEACNRFDVMEKVPGISCPVLVCSAEHDVSTPVKYGLWLKDHLPSATYTLIAGSGHLSMIEKPQALNDAIRAFLSGLSRA